MHRLQRALSAIFRPGHASVVTDEARLDKNAMARARRLAERHGIKLERDRDGYWVSHPRVAETGNAFCVGGREVLSSVEAHAEALATIEAGAQA